MQNKTKTKQSTPKKGKKSSQARKKKKVYEKRADRKRATYGCFRRTLESLVTVAMVLVLRKGTCPHVRALARPFLRGVSAPALLRRLQDVVVLVVRLQQTRMRCQSLSLGLLPEGGGVQVAGSRDDGIIARAQSAERSAGSTRSPDDSGGRAPGTWATHSACTFAETNGYVQASRRFKATPRLPAGTSPAIYVTASEL